VPRPAAQATAPAAAQAPVRPNGPEIADPGGDVAVSPAKAGLTRVGAEKCKLCHKAQYSSWAASAHARRTPPLDCESCHGLGSEYKALAVMKDPAKARARKRELRASLAVLAREHDRLWHARNRPGGYADSAKRLANLSNDYK